MKKKLTDNLGLKVLALIVSFIIWFIVVNINDPVDRIVFRNIPVEIQNAKMLTDEGKVYEVVDGTDSIDITVWAQRTILDSLERDNFIATADMADLNLANNQTKIKVSSNKVNDKLDSIISSEEYLKLNIEDLKSRQLVVDTVTIGEPADGYILGNVTTEQNLVRISGAQSSVDKVKSAVASVDINGLSQNVRTGSTIRLLDEDDNIIEDERISKSIEQINVGIEILQTKRVPMNFQMMGTPAEGYVASGEIISEPSTVEIAASQLTLRGVDRIDIPESEINITGQSGDVTIRVNMKKYLPTGVVFADADFDGIINVTAKIESVINKTIELDMGNIILKNVPDDMKASLYRPDADSEEAEIEILVSGRASVIEEANLSNIKATVDINKYLEDQGLEGLTSGKHRLPAEIVLPEGISIVRPLFVDVEIE